MGGWQETISIGTYKKSCVGVLKVYHMETELGACQKGKATVFSIRNTLTTWCSLVIYLNVG